MKSKTVFTKRDLIVFLGSAIFLLANLGAIGSSGRRRAKEAVCLSNLRQWGTVFQMYAQDNDGYFMKGWTAWAWDTEKTDYWMEALRPYYSNPDLRCCPEAVIPGTELGAGQYGGNGTFTAWGVFTGAWAPVVPGDYGSYGMNGWVCNPPPTPWTPDEYNWRIANVAGADNVPLFGDHHWLDCWPDHTDDPPDYDGQPWPQGSQMGRVCINRHSGFLNSAFLDFSARKVGLKELWKLKWHRQFDVNYPPPAWPEWMQDFQDY